MKHEPSDPHDHGPFAIDLNVARIARFENFLAGGEAHFAVDRAAVESVCDLARGGLAGMRGMIEALWAFVGRTVTVLTGELGARQYLDIGMATPTTGMVHHIAAKLAPDTRVVYASTDPTTLAYVHTLAAGARDGTVAHIHAAYHDTGKILRGATATLDLAQPVAVLLPTTLNLVPDDDVARRVVDDLRDAVAPGSWLALAHTSLDLAPEGSEVVLKRFNQMVDDRYVTRTEADIRGFLDGFDLIEPGLVPIQHWRPDDPTAIDGRRPFPIYGAVGHKPTSAVRLPEAR